MGTLQESFEEVELKIRELERELVSRHNPNPNMIAAFRTRMTGYYSWMGGEKCELEIKKNRWFREHREEFKSDKACEAEWLATKEGELFTRMSYSLKGLEKIISALRTQIETAKNDWNYA
jgi:hypothetical protein